MYGLLTTLIYETSHGNGNVKMRLIFGDDSVEFGQNSSVSDRSRILCEFSMSSDAEQLSELLETWGKSLYYNWVHLLKCTWENGFFTSDPQIKQKLSPEQIVFTERAVLYNTSSLMKCITRETTDRGKW